MNRKCEQIADALYNILAPPGGLLKDPKLPFDLRWVAGHKGVNLHVPSASPVYIALSVQAVIDEQKEIIRLLQPRLASKGYQRYDSSLRFDPRWDGVLTALGPAEGDTPEEVAQLQKLGNLVRSMIGQNGPEALAAALAEMDAMQAASASARQQ